MLNKLLPISKIHTQHYWGGGVTYMINQGERDMSSKHYKGMASMWTCYLS